MNKLNYLILQKAKYMLKKKERKYFHSPDGSENIKGLFILGSTWVKCLSL